MISQTQRRIFELQKRIISQRTKVPFWQIEQWEKEIAILQIDLQQEQAIAQAKQAKANTSQPVAAQPTTFSQPSFSQPYSKPQYSIGASQYFDALNQQRETQRREGLARETYQSFLDRTGGTFATAMGATAALEARKQRRGLESETQRLATERQVAETQQIREQAQQRRQSVAQRRAELAAQRGASQLAQQQAAELARQEADFRAKQRENDPYSQRTQRRMLGVQAGLGVGQFAPKTTTLPYQIEEDSEWAAVPAGFLGFGSSAGFVPRSQLSSMTLPPRPLEPSRYFAGYIRQ